MTHPRSKSWDSNLDRSGSKAGKHGSREVLITVYLGGNWNQIAPLCFSWGRRSGLTGVKSERTPRHISSQSRESSCWPHGGDSTPGQPHNPPQLWGQDVVEVLIEAPKEHAVRPPTCPPPLPQALNAWTLITAQPLYALVPGKQDRVLKGLRSCKTRHTDLICFLPRHFVSLSRL